MKKLFILVVISLCALFASAQFNIPWQGKKCAVAITYDDAIDQHLDNAIPVLDSLGLKATFYLTAFSTSMQKRLNEWQKLAVNGHELGNHTLFHPCLGGKGREWVKPDQDMSKYTVQRMIEETRMANLFLQALDGKTKRTFAFTCGDMKIGDSSFMNAMKDDFVAARAVRNQMHKINEVDLYNVDCYVVNGETGEQLIDWVKKAMETNSLLVVLFHGNTTGGNLLDEKLRAALELLISTGDKRFADSIAARLPDFERQLGRFASLAVRAIPYMDASFKNKIESAVKNYKKNLDQLATQNPFGVPIGTGGWAGSGQVIGFANTNYLLHKAFPQIIDAEYVFRGLNFIYGCHPGSDISLVSAVGTISKEVAYGNNRADFTFIAGGIVPGVLILPPDFPENKEDWPFIWGENEYVINLGASYIFLVHAVNDLLNVR